MITRDEVVRRMSTVWQPGTVVYSQRCGTAPDGRRADCSDYVGACWGLPGCSYNTETLVTLGIMGEIPLAGLLPGDAVGMCGPGTTGNAGHIQLVESYDPATGHAVIWEQAGGTVGPLRRQLKRIDPTYKAYRLAAIGEPPTPTPDEEDDTVKGIIIQREGQGIALLYPHPITGEMVWSSIGDSATAEAWNKAGWPGPVAVADINACGRNAAEAGREVLAAMAAGGSGGNGAKLAVTLAGEAVPA